MTTHTADFSDDAVTHRVGSPPSAARVLIITSALITASILTMTSPALAGDKADFLTAEGGTLPDLDGESLKADGPELARCYFASAETRQLICIGVREHVEGSEYTVAIFDLKQGKRWSETAVSPTEGGRLESHAEILDAFNDKVDTAKDWEWVEPVWTADFNLRQVDGPAILPGGLQVRLLEAEAVKDREDGDTPPVDEKRTLQVETEAGDVVTTLDVTSGFLAGDHHVTVWTTPGAPWAVVALTDYTPGYASRKSRFELLSLSEGDH